MLRKQRALPSAGRFKGQPLEAHPAPPAPPARPLSKTVRFNVLRVIPAGSAGNKKGFSGF